LLFLGAYFSYVSILAVGVYFLPILIVVFILPLAQTSFDDPALLLSKRDDDTALVDDHDEIKQLFLFFSLPYPLSLFPALPLSPNFSLFLSGRLLLTTSLVPLLIFPCSPPHLPLHSSKRSPTPNSFPSLAPTLPPSLPVSLLSLSSQGRREG
jgi:hypothetical protein